MSGHDTVKRGDPTMAASSPALMQLPRWLFLNAESLEIEVEKDNIALILSGKISFLQAAGNFDRGNNYPRGKS